MKEYSVAISEAIDWNLTKGQSLREALTDEAEESLGVSDQDGTIKITVVAGDFVCTFRKHRQIGEQR